MISEVNEQRESIHFAQLETSSDTNLEYLVREVWEFDDIQRLSYTESLTILNTLNRTIEEHPYCLPLYILLSRIYLHLYYPDLAAGAAYKALLLCDATQDEVDEYHMHAVRDTLLFSSLKSSALWVQILGGLHAEVQLEPSQIQSWTEPQGGDESTRAESWVKVLYLPLVYQYLTCGLELCGCYQSASNFCSRSVKLYPENAAFQKNHDRIREKVARHLEIEVDKLGNPSNWPEQGYVRREEYPWNTHEPDRLKELHTLNNMMRTVAPKLEVRIVELPDLTKSARSDGDVVAQVGVFAKEDIGPGEIVLQETSMLTANNKLQDALCDACSTDLPAIFNATGPMVRCTDCEAVFCSKFCYERAMEEYHPAICDRDVEVIGKDVPPPQAPDALYALLLLRSLAMAETQQCHPLDLKEIKFIFADFHSMPLGEHWRPHDFAALEQSDLPRSLPFSFEYNIRLPFHMLEKMDIDIFSAPQYDVWVFNTLYAKFRATASARLGRAGRGPEVCAVHPLWCLANHSCDPNVSWEWASSIKFWTRGKRATWRNKKGEEMKREGQAMIKKDDEILNHYCDIDLPVDDRREWARGALGGDCRCARCLWEAGDEEQQ